MNLAGTHLHRMFGVFFSLFLCSVMANCPLVQLQKDLVLLLCLVLKVKESNNSFWKYYGVFFLEAVANMQITCPKLFSSAKFPKEKEAANLCTNITNWEQGKGHKAEKNDTQRKSPYLWPFLTPTISAHKTKSKWQKKVPTYFSSLSLQKIMWFICFFLWGAILPKLQGCA